MPKVSVIIPTFNGSRFIKKTIYSVLRQTLNDLEVIVVDDGSTDETQNILKGIVDKRMKCFSKANGGVSSARNYGLSKARGEYTAFLDHDDLWPDRYLEVMVAALEKEREYGLAYSPITLMPSDGAQNKSCKTPEGKSGWLTVELFKKGFVWTSAAVMRKSVLHGIRYDEQLRLSYEDADFFLRLSASTPFLFVSDIKGIRRRHNDNLSVKAGILPTRILVLERFYYMLGGAKVIPHTVAKRKISHACRKVAEAKRLGGSRCAALCLYKRAIRYWPFDLRLYLGLAGSLLLNKKSDPNANWRIPQPLDTMTTDQTNRLSGEQNEHYTSGL